MRHKASEAVAVQTSARSPVVLSSVLADRYLASPSPASSAPLRNQQTSVALHRRRHRDASGSSRRRGDYRRRRRVETAARQSSVTKFESSSNTENWDSSGMPSSLQLPKTFSCSTLTLTRSFMNSGLTRSRPLCGCSLPWAPRHRRSRRRRDPLPHERSTTNSNKPLDSSKNGAAWRPRGCCFLV